MFNDFRCYNVLIQRTVILATAKLQCGHHQFTLIIGADNWAAFDRWAHPQDILQHYPVVIYPREGYPVDAATLPEGVTLVNTRLYRVSSTDIRQRIREHRPVRRLLPVAIYYDAIEAYSKR